MSATRLSSLLYNTTHCLWFSQGFLLVRSRLSSFPHSLTKYIFLPCAGVGAPRAWFLYNALEVQGTLTSIHFRTRSVDDVASWQTRSLHSYAGRCCYWCSWVTLAWFTFARCRLVRATAVYFTNHQIAPPLKWKHSWVFACRLWLLKNKPMPWPPLSLLKDEADRRRSLPLLLWWHRAVEVSGELQVHA